MAAIGLHDDPREEFASAITHVVGAAIALIAGIVLIVLAASGGTVWQVVSAVVFSISLLLLYSASALYHSSKSTVARVRFKIFDHCAIYLLIAGTYTPFTLIGLRGTLGWWLFGAIWGLALAGVIFKLFYTGRFKLLSTGIYLAMGWLVVLAIKPVMAALDTWTFAWLIAGGMFYTLGTFFYHRESIRYSHAIWHLFCIGGSASHYVAILAQVMQRPPAG